MAVVSCAGIARRHYSQPLCRLCTHAHIPALPCRRKPPAQSSLDFSRRRKKQHFAPSGNPNCSAGFSVSRGGLALSPASPCQAARSVPTPAWEWGPPARGSGTLPPAPPRLCPRSATGVPHCLTAASPPGMFTRGDSCSCRRPPGLCPGSRGKGWTPARSWPRAERLRGFWGGREPSPRGGEAR